MIEALWCTPRLGQLEGECCSALPAFDRSEDGSAPTGQRDDDWVGSQPKAIARPVRKFLLGAVAHSLDLLGVSRGRTVGGESLRQAVQQSSKHPFRVGQADQLTGGSRGAEDTKRSRPQLPILPMHPRKAEAPSKTRQADDDDTGKATTTRVQVPVEACHQDRKRTCHGPISKRRINLNPAVETPVAAPAKPDQLGGRGDDETPHGKRAVAPSPVNHIHAASASPTVKRASPPSNRYSATPEIEIVPPVAIEYMISSSHRVPSLWSRPR